MIIIEQYIQGKKDGISGEDALLATPHFMAVIDGSTSKSKLSILPNGCSSGKMAAQLVTSVIQDMSPQTSIQEFVEKVNQLFQAQYAHFYSKDIFGGLQSTKENRWTCSAIIYSKFENAIWMIGDCLGLLIGSNGQIQTLSNEKPYEKVLAQQRADYLHRQLALGTITVQDVRRHDVGRDQIIPTMLQEMKNQNVEYAVLDGFDIAWKAVKVVPCRNCAEIVLATDGYPKLFPTLQETEQYLQKCLSDDPLMIHYHVATKACMEGYNSFDDRTYLRFQP